MTEEGRTMRFSWRRFVITAVAIASLSLMVIAVGQSATSTSKKKITINVWDVQYFPKQGGSAGALGKAELKIDQMFMKAYPNIIVKHVGVSGAQFFPSMQTFVAGRKGPDIVTNGGGSFPQTSGFSKAMVPMYNLITKTMKKELGNQLAAEGIGDEPHYSIPIQAHVYLFYYNKALFKQAGISGIPKTLNDLLGDCAALKKIGVTPISSGFAGGAPPQEWDFGIASQILGNYALTAWGSRKIGWNDPRIVPGLKYLQQMAKAGCFGDPSAAAVRTGPDGLTMFQGGKAAMNFNNVLDTTTLGSGIGGIGNVGTFAFPKVPTSVYPIGTPDSGYNANWSIMSYTKNLCASWNYVKFWVSQPAQRVLWNVGHTLPINHAVKVKGRNGVEDGILALAANKYGHTGPGATTSGQEAGLGGRLFPLLVSGSLSPENLASQLQDARSALPPLAPAGKLPKPAGTCR
jgi:ABC-type glycerol-3-phosphate transport system substrate-binding protein